MSQYLSNKKESIKQKDSEDIQKYSRVKEQKLGQIEELGKLESMMVERQARSKMTSDESALRLRRLIKGGKAVSTSHTSKLPSVREKARLTDQDILLV